MFVEKPRSRLGWALGVGKNAMGEINLYQYPISPFTEKMRELAPPAREQLRGYLRMLDDQLAGKDFFLGRSFTMADASLYHPLYFLGLIPPNFSIVKDFANVNRWFERVRDLA